MTASPFTELRTLIFERLTTDAAVNAAIGARVYDGVPEDAVLPYITFGQCDWSVENDDEGCTLGLRVTLTLDIWSRNNRKLRPAEDIAFAALLALNNYRGELPTHGLKSLSVEAGQSFPDEDGETAHAALPVTALIDLVTE